MLTGKARQLAVENGDDRAEPHFMGDDDVRLESRESPEQAQVDMQIIDVVDARNAGFFPHLKLKGEYLPFLEGRRYPKFPFAVALRAAMQDQRIEVIAKSIVCRKAIGCDHVGQNCESLLHYWANALRIQILAAVSDTDQSEYRLQTHQTRRYDWNLFSGIGRVAMKGFAFPGTSDAGS